MPIKQAAKKALRSSERKRVFNLRRTRAMRETMKEVREAAANGKKDETKRLLDTAYKAIDKAAQRGVIKKNTAARKKSRLSRFVAKGQ